MSVSAQALDVVYGRPAAGVRVRLDRSTSDGWLAIAHAAADDDGQVHDWVDHRLERGSYRIVLDSDSYFANLGVSAAYPEVAVAFVIQDETDACRIHVLLAPYSYSMFFGARG